MQERNSKGQFEKNSIPWNKNKKDLQIPWNKGLTKETDNRVKKYAEKLKERTCKEIPWNKGIHTNLHSKTEWKKGQIPWNKGLTKETDERVRRNAESVKKTHWAKGKHTWNKGLTKETDERVRRNAESVKKTHWTKKSKHEVDKITEKMRLARLSQKFPRKFTKIEMLLSESIKKENISFKNHKNILNITEVDIFIEPNICIYCDGDYWHANPDKYDYSNIDSNQQWHVERDKRNNKILIDNGFIVIRFWESDIKNSIDKCMNEILLIINTNN